MGPRKGDSVVIDPATRRVTSINGDACTEMTPELEALVEETLGPKNKDEVGRMKDEGEKRTAAYKHAVKAGLG